MPMRATKLLVLDQSASILARRGDIAGLVGLGFEAFPTRSISCAPGQEPWPKTQRLRRRWLKAW